MVIDLAARFAPLDPLCFQAWECLTRYQEPGAIFQANRQFRSQSTHGNLSNMGNLPGLRQDRPQVFTTDAHGFRNPPGNASARVDGLVVGDSFVAGYGITDSETLPVQLGAAAGLRLYNAGGPYAYLETARSLKARFGLRRAPVVVVWTESEPVAQLRDAESRAIHPDVRSRMLASVLGSGGERLRALARGWWYTSPVQILAEKAYLAMANDRVLPNIYAERVVQGRLRNGDPMLFYPPDVEGFRSHRDVREAADYLMWLATALRQAELTPLVVLAPSKYSVYNPLLDDPHPAPGDAVHPLARLEQALRSGGVPALDLTPAFRDQARRDLSKREYIYWLDDTHWNGRGVGVAADLIRRAWFDQQRPE
jgi:hypothetical protein